MTSQLLVYNISWKEAFYTEIPFSHMANRGLSNLWTYPSVQSLTPQPPPLAAHSMS